MTLEKRSESSIKDFSSSVDGETKVTNRMFVIKDGTMEVGDAQCTPTSLSFNIRMFNDVTIDDLTNMLTKCIAQCVK